MSDDTTEPADLADNWLGNYRVDRDGDSIRFHPEPSRSRSDLDERPLTRDVAFNRHTMNDGEHVGPFDNNMTQIGTDGIRVHLAQGIDEDALRKTLSMATRATIGLDMNDPASWEDSGDSEEMFKGGLQTALESQTIVFAVSGVSRTCTHQLVRSRRAAFHQQSQRASYLGDNPEVRMPESIWLNVRARGAFFRAQIAALQAYQTICEEDIAYQDARFVLPEGTTNFIMLEYPIREFLNVFAYRGCSMFQWEIVHVMRECRRVLVEAHPFMEPYVKISCEKTGPAKIDVQPLMQIHQASCDVTRGEPCSCGGTKETVAHQCTFQGWEDVEGQCDFSWAREEARTFKPEHHRIARGK